MTAVQVSQALRLMDGPFATMANAVAEGQFVVWVGSGASFGYAPGLRELLEKVFDHLLSRLDPSDPSCAFRAALDEILKLANLSDAEIAGLDLTVSFANWADAARITKSLSNQYSKVLDTRIRGQTRDYLVWNAVDVRGTYGALAVPGASHYSIAALVMEGVVSNIASANWDPLIERAVEQLSGGTPYLQVIVDPADLRTLPGRARLLKFHGCAERCLRDGVTYRPYIVAARSQITDWPNNQLFAALRNELISIATTSRTLMVGLSLQDTNLQDVFSRARNALQWCWPLPDGVPGHVFCELALGDDQRNMLRVVYDDRAYEEHGLEIERTALFPAYAGEVLCALLLDVLSKKMQHLTERVVSYPELAAGLLHLRDRVAAHATGNLRDFLLQFLKCWSNEVSMFRRAAPPTARNYEPLTGTPLSELAREPNIENSGLPGAALAMSLLGGGETQGKWRLDYDDVGDAGLVVNGAWSPDNKSHVKFASNAAVAIKLIKDGALAGRSSVVIHSDHAWFELSGRRAPSRAPRTAPGRTGRIGTRHVSIPRVTGAARTFDELQSAFEKEAML